MLPEPGFSKSKISIITTISLGRLKGETWVPHNHLQIPPNSGTLPSFSVYLLLKPRLFPQPLVVGVLLPKTPQLFPAPFPPKTLNTKSKALRPIRIPLKDNRIEIAWLWFTSNLGLLLFLIIIMYLLVIAVNYVYCRHTKFLLALHCVG